VFLLNDSYTYSGSRSIMFVIKVTQKKYVYLLTDLLSVAAECAYVAIAVL